MAEADQSEGPDHPDGSGDKVEYGRNVGRKSKVVGRLKNGPHRKRNVSTYDLRPTTFVSSSMRLDKFLQVSRLVKRRAIAHTLCDRGRVRLNGATAKGSDTVQSEDVITIVQGDRRLVAKVLRVPDRPRPSKEIVEILDRVNIEEWVAGERQNTEN